MRWLGLLLLSVALLLSGCGLVSKAVDKASEKAVEKAVEKATGVSVDQNGNSVTVKGQDGQSVTIQNTEAKLPEGFPIKAHSGGKVASGSSMKANGKTSWVVEIDFDSDIKPVADYYEKAYKDLGIAVNRMDTDSNGDLTVLLSGESDKLTVYSTITWTKDEKGKVAIILGDK